MFVPIEKKKTKTKPVKQAAMKKNVTKQVQIIDKVTNTLMLIQEKKMKTKQEKANVVNKADKVLTSIPKVRSTIKKAYCEPLK